jgi:hypothetical protein
MSWNNSLPLWVWQVTSERIIAESQCCFQDEWYAGTPKVMPKHVIEMSPATFKSWDEGGWNHDN